MLLLERAVVAISVTNSVRGSVPCALFRKYLLYGLTVHTCIDMQTTRCWGPLGKRAGDHLGEPGWSRRQKYTNKTE